VQFYLYRTVLFLLDSLWLSYCSLHWNEFGLLRSYTLQTKYLQVLGTCVAVAFLIVGEIFICIKSPGILYDAGLKIFPVLFIERCRAPRLLRLLRPKPRFVAHIARNYIHTVMHIRRRQKGKLVWLIVLKGGNTGS
jgi:hypothetical protein